MSRNSKPERWRVKLVAGVIRQVRGKPLLEALFNLQGGYCAYDRQECLLLLPPTDEFVALGLSLTKDMKARCATIDHVVPRARGGSNNIDNFVMASQIRNCEKGALDPKDEWTPKAKRWPVKVIEDEIIRVEHRRWAEAESLAHGVSTKSDAKRAVVSAELEKLFGTDTIEIYTQRRLRKIRNRQKRVENGEKTQETKKPSRRPRSKPVRPRRTVKDKF